MKTSLLLFALGILFLQPVVAQQFKFGVGTSVANESEISTVPIGYTPSPTVLMCGVALTPSYTFPVSKKLAVSVELPLTVARIPEVYKPLDHGNSIYSNRAKGVSFNIPLVANLSYKIGQVSLFGGGGLNLRYNVLKYKSSTGVSYSSESGYSGASKNVTYSSTGVIVNAGVRLYNIELRAYYAKGMTHEKPDVRGGTISYLF